MALPSLGAASVAEPMRLSLLETTNRDARAAVDVNGNALAMFFYGDDGPPGQPPAYCKLDFGVETTDCTVGSRSWSGGTLLDLEDLSARFSGQMGQGEVAADGTGQVFAVWGGTSQWGGVGELCCESDRATGAGRTQQLSLRTHTIRRWRSTIKVPPSWPGSIRWSSPAST